jgi:hypothetical protein
MKFVCFAGKKGTNNSPLTDTFSKGASSLLTLPVATGNLPGIVFCKTNNSGGFIPVARIQPGAGARHPD